ncbi:metallophosphoesterase [Marinimicrobium sp. ABcell2]|uniref:metallophosphoesterase n=1 Tax=Marinimicrobium sp. ABcell2 TaxID=3069751 RepID=UPI0027AF1290|nr:metallophosphoesterase [Marinimicrobium sp. ABcell2]MDQ2078010.1 metallophosphoesterase [Marinimicrobium sp. ABcell2]
MDRSSAPKGYDIIGDVHGCGFALERLLEKLGYQEEAGVYRHPERKVVFLGDIIDRGPHIREALRLVRAMVEAGEAQMVLGNHEFNALAYFTPSADPERDYLRPHIPRNARQLAETREQFGDTTEEWQDYLDWFLSLPLFLEFENFRVVHACWDAQLIEQHRQRYGEGYINREFLEASANPNSLEGRIKQRLTSGVDLPLPDGMSIVSSDGYERNNFRTKFWAPDAQTYGDLLFQPDPLPPGVAQSRISPEHREQMVTYGPDEPPLFVGHYWLKGHPQPIAPNIACLDYSAVKFGRLVAYRFDGEAQLREEKFVWIYVDP